MKNDLYVMSEMIRKFCTERDWDQFHNPKDLAIGISTEANELLDLFRFQSAQQVNDLMQDPQTLTLVQEELADVLFFVLRFAQMNGIDLQQSLVDKLAKSAVKYPIEQAKGNNQKYNRR
jgi:NTP pyrophosphatase (non-canonical NTP hydrolase)